jgi:glycosyltransferase involved in cell wall biosynthesis
MNEIGFITEDYWRGGLAKFNTVLINSWPDKSAKFTIFTNRENIVLHESIFNLNVQYVYFDFKTLSSDLAEKRGILKKIYRRTVFKYGFYFKRYFAFRKLLGKYNIKNWIISNGGYPGSDLCRLALLILKREKGIFIFHGAVQKPWLLFHLIEKLLDKIIFYKNRFRIVTVSKANAKTISKRQWLNAVPVKVVHNGIEISDNISQKAHSSDKHIVSMLSGLRPYKGQNVIIQAAERLKSDGVDLSVRFYGADFEKFLAGIKTNIRNSRYPEMFSMPGYCPVEKIMEEADLVVVPSLTHESFGYTAAEAMGYGVPVIVSDVGGLPEIVGDCGIICKAGDITAWTEAIKVALSDNELRERNIKKGLKRAIENFQAESMAKEYERLLAQYDAGI